MAIAEVLQPVATLIQRKRRWLVGIGFVLLAGVMVGIWFVGQNWPFRYRIIHPELEDMFGSQVHMTHYARSYFPNPGFVATGLTLQSKSAPTQAPIGTVQQLIVQGHWLDLLFLRRRLQLVELKGFHLVLPPPGSQASRDDFPPGSAEDFIGPETPIQTLEVTDSMLQIERTDGGSFWFPIRQLHIENMHRGQPMTFAVDMQNAIPSGRIRASGWFGPLNPKDLGATPVSGQFQFTQVRLEDVGEIHGIASSFGRFQGRLGALETSASVNTPNFSVKDGHPTPLNGQLDCTVNGLNGDVAFHSMEARSGESVVYAEGSVAGAPKSAHLVLRVPRGRAEDLLRPFLHRDPPIRGLVALHATAYVAPTREGSFLQRLQVDGAFDVPSEKVTDPATEKQLSAFSQRAQGRDTPDSDDPGYAQIPDAISSVAGPAVIRNAVMSTRRLTFQVPGAEAHLSGTFNFHTSTVHLQGDLRMKADVSHAETGFKSFLLKPFAPFFRHKHAGAVVPIAVTGTPGHYKVGQNIFH
jgi:hypothetical protein